MTTINQVLDTKGHDVLTVGPDDTVLRALEQMASKNVGAVIVTENGAPVGIFTERDYARSVILKGRSSPTTPVREVMSSEVIFVRPEQTVEECMAIMSDKRFRHMPVLQEGTGPRYRRSGVKAPDRCHSAAPERPLIASTLPFPTSRAPARAYSWRCNRATPGRWQKR